MIERKSRGEEESNVVDFPGGLDPSQFRVSGVDSKGHTTRIWASVQPMHAQTIDILIQSKKFPYRTRGDFIRHAIVRHIHWLEKIYKPLNSVTGALDAMNALLRDAEFRAEFTEYLGRLNKQIKEMVAEGDISAARRLLLETIRCVETMPEGYWRDKYATAIREEHKDLLENMPRASFATFGEEK
jgi:hypothetical protein